MVEGDVSIVIPTAPKPKNIPIVLSNKKKPQAHDNSATKLIDTKVKSPKKRSKSKAKRAKKPTGYQTDRRLN